MSGAGGIQPFLISPAAAQVPGLGALRPGQTFQTLIQGEQGHMFIRLANLKIPIADMPGVTPGQNAHAEIVSAENGPQVRITISGQTTQAQPPAQPQAQPNAPAAQTTAQAAPLPQTGQPVQGQQPPSQTNAPAAQVSTAPSHPTQTAEGTAPSAQPPTAAPQSSAASSPVQVLSRATANVLAKMGSLPSARQAIRILPPAFPPNEAAIRGILSLFVSNEQIWANLRQLQSMVTDASRAGAAPQGLVERLAGLLASVFGAKDGNIETLIKQWADNRKTFEARLAAAIRSGNLANALDAIEGDARGTLSRLANDESLLKFMRETGRENAFKQTLNNVLERLTGAALQNTRGTEQPYVFVEVPAAPDSEFERLQLHIKGNKKGGRKRIDPRNAVIAFDLRLSRLGDIWIRLSIAGGACSCDVRAVTPETVEAFKNDEADLKKLLESLGFDSPKVMIEDWDGDRLREAAAIVQEKPGMDFTA